MEAFAFNDYNFEFLVTQPGATMGVRPYFELLQQEFPKAFAACCICERPKLTDPPLCSVISDLWSACFRRHSGDAVIARFLVEQLGMFGIFGNLISDVPPSLLNHDLRLS